MGEKVIVNIKAFMDGHRPPDRVLARHAVRSVRAGGFSLSRADGLARRTVFLPAML